MFENISAYIQELGRSHLIYALDKIDSDFKHSTERKRQFYIKGYRTRTIITILGPITFKRTLYQSKSSKKCFTYLDRHLGLPKYDTYDPCIKSKIIEAYSDHNSMIKVGNIIGEQIYSSFSTNSVRKNFNISRQTVFNIVRKSQKIIPEISRSKHTPKTLYIMVDGKHVNLQNENKRSIEVKQFVVFEGITSNSSQKRSKLLGRHIISSIDSSDKSWEKVNNYIYERYDLELVERIIIMGDGASWIKKGIHEIENSIFSLDLFHIFQNINRFTTEEDERLALRNMIIHNDYENYNKLGTFLFKRFTEETEANLKLTSEQQENIISKKQEQLNYILKNWEYIQINFEPYHLGCGMEGQISHNIASTFTSRPKAYKEKNLSHYIEYRDMQRNGVDILKAALLSFDMKYTETPQKVKKETLDFSIFEPTHSNDLSSKSAWFRNYKNKI